MIKKTVASEEYKNIVVIDALSTPLGLEAFEQYVDYSAMALYYNGNNNQQSKENNKKAKDVLEREWKDRIHDGQFIIYSYAEQDGEKATGANAVHTILQTIVLNKYRTKDERENVVMMLDGLVRKRFGILETLVQRSELFAYTNVHLFLFAKSGFTKGCIDKAAELGNVTLVTYAKLKPYATYSKIHA